MTPPLWHPLHGTPSWNPLHGTPSWNPFTAPLNGTPQWNSLIEPLHGTSFMAPPTWHPLHGTPSWNPIHGIPLMASPLWHLLHGPLFIVGDAVVPCEWAFRPGQDTTSPTFPKTGWILSKCLFSFVHGPEIPPGSTN